MSKKIPPINSKPFDVDLYCNPILKEYTKIYYTKKIKDKTKEDIEMHNHIVNLFNAIILKECNTPSLILYRKAPKFIYKYRDLKEFQSLNKIGSFKGEGICDSWFGAGILPIIEIKNIKYYVFGVNHTTTPSFTIDILGGTRDWDPKKPPVDIDSRYTAAREFWEESGKIFLLKNNNDIPKEVKNYMNDSLKEYIYSKKGGYVLYKIMVKEGNSPYDLFIKNGYLNYFIESGDKKEMSELVYIKKSYLDKRIRDSHNSLSEDDIKTFNFENVILKDSEMYLEIDLENNTCIRATNLPKTLTYSRLPLRDVACWLLWLNLELNKKIKS